MFSLPKISRDIDKASSRNLLVLNGTAKSTPSGPKYLINSVDDLHKIAPPHKIAQTEWSLILTYTCVIDILLFVSIKWVNVYKHIFPPFPPPLFCCNTVPWLDCYAHFFCIYIYAFAILFPFCFQRFHCRIFAHPLLCFCSLCFLSFLFWSYVTKVMVILSVFNFFFYICLFDRGARLRIWSC